MKRHLATLVLSGILGSLAVGSAEACCFTKSYCAPTYCAPTYYCPPVTYYCPPPCYYYTYCGVTYCCYYTAPATTAAPVTYAAAPATYAYPVAQGQVAARR
jgi:hypothetical protein